MILLLFGGFVILGSVSVIAETVDCNNHPYGIQTRQCCEIPEMFNKNLTKTCFTEIPKNRTKLINRGKCVQECVAKKIGLFENEEINKSEVTKLLKSKITEKSFQSIIESAIEFCSDQAIVKMKQFEKQQQSKNIGPDENVCSPLPLIYFNCIRTRLVVNCPLDQYKTDTKCNELKEFNEKCGTQERN